MFATRRFDKLQTYDVWLNAVLAAFLPLELLFRSVRAETIGLQQLIQRTSDITPARQTLETELAGSEKATAELLQRIPTAPRESDFLAQVCRLADQTGVEVADYHPQSIEKRENHQEMQVKLSMRGGYPALCQFLAEVDHLPRLCRLTQLEVGSAVAGTRLPVEMTFRIYLAPPGDSDPKKKG
jgi:Tfp pilus assembly protein PilO